MRATTPHARVRLVSVRHSNGRRILTVLDRATLQTYTRCVAQVAWEVEAGLSQRVLANRVAACSTDPLELRLQPWRVERNAFAVRLSELAERWGALVFVDVRRCYPSISPAVVGAELRRIGVATAGEVESFLRGLQAEGVCGLPVGPDPSAVLANAVLGHVDRRLEEIGLTHVRWVDDVVLASPDPASALRLVRRALAEIGLRVNEAKTRIIVGAPAAVLGPHLGSPTGRIGAPTRR
jgi:hypothetical protein